MQKKKIILSAVLTSSLFLYACGENEKVENNSNEAENVETQNKNDEMDIFEE